MPTPKDEKITTVSVRANEAYKAAVKELARRRGVRVGDLVREALDFMCGSNLAELSIFFATDLESVDKTNDSRTTEKSQVSVEVMMS